MASYIRFDWAMKRMLRDKANYGVLEGLITTLLGKRIKIQKLLESESNQEHEDDKQNRVDVLAEDESGALYLIEVQNETEFAYFQRMLFGTSKLVTEYINRGQGYENIRKVYAINIVYFKLGEGSDYVYHGKTEFRGIHDNEVLRLSPFQQQKFSVDAVSDLYPEYWILKVNDFSRWSRVPLEQWIYFLNTGEIPDDADAPGLDEARQKLKLDHMTREELRAYYRHLDNVVILRDNITTARGEGKLEGRAEGIAEGRAKGIAEGRAEGIAEGRAEGRTKTLTETARKLKAMGLPAEQIAEGTGLSIEEIARL
ncbi:Rpn family recombination-promoting nuclease/putative transposase [[Hallella] seregens]|uniref:Rpn family recombination-promoting nuclease/putative transposase n=1 Tax=Hallella seregens ATCC 51272 TaxID=1336250 RepID=A0ABV5ZIQ7_9BACT|nr:Rpn family recombination-promoting nuclease/putative transposase [Hallella seregens]